MIILYSVFPTLCVKRIISINIVILEYYLVTWDLNIPAHRF